MGVRLGEQAIGQLKAVTRDFFGRARAGTPPDAGDPRGFAWLLKVQTPSGGIAASSSASCTGGTWSGSNYTSTGDTYTAWNPSSGNAVAASTWVTIGWVSGRWEVILEPC